MIINFFMVILGLCGKMGAGKDTVAYYLTKTYTNTAFQWSFAAKLKDMAKELFGVVKKDAKGRKILQEIGTKMREIDENVWVDYVINKIKTMPCIGCLHVITDVRFVNEAEAILKEGGIIICLDADSETRRLRCCKRDGREISNEEWTLSSMHGSETGVDDIIKKFRDAENFNIINITKETTVGHVNGYASWIIEQSN